ncbi:MAG: pentapeptide repeat-containing protein [Rothia sp.]|nr:pentapeptide repeat-containing protein [Rothia sp. (in: high G+C Gram-positive bacteria)]
MLSGDRSFQRRWEIVLADNETSIKKPPFYIRWFFPILVFLGCLGGFLALTVPLWKSWAETPKTNFIESIIGWIGSVLSSFIPPSDADKYPEGKVIADVRLHILYITGGIIAILTLLQTNWKNQVDRRKVEDDIQKNKNDHNHQVHAERRSRYTKAVEQLTNEKAAVRLGGVYTLIELIDEWLNDENLDESDSLQKGQTIVNILCSYIRSPFQLAINKNILLADTAPANYVGDFAADQITLREEQNVRRTIFVEMSNRSNASGKDKSGEDTVTADAWSNFDFDFSRAPIFYPLNNLTIEKANFSSAKFYGSADLREVTFTQNADFREAIFTRDANFKNATFVQNASFENATFDRYVNFSGSTFIQNVNFIWARFTNFEPTFVAGQERARFSTNVVPEENLFAPTRGDKPIRCGRAEIHGKPFKIPLGTVLFDPGSWDEAKQDYTRFSNPAQHIENSTCTIKRICKKIKKRLP